MADTPSDKSMPRSILVADARMYRQIAHDSDDVALLEDLDAAIVPYSGRPEVNEQQILTVRDALSAAGQLIPGTLLIKNPYETTNYEFAEQAIESFASAKYHALANTARLLGAREIHFIEAKTSSNTSNSTGGAKVKIPAGAGQADITKDLTKKLEERLEGLMKFPGAEPAPQEALDYLRRRNLSGDQQLKDLVEMRTGANLISEYKMTLSGTRESTANFKSALKIANAGPVKAVDIGGSFTRTAETINSIEVTTEIFF